METASAVTRVAVTLLSLVVIFGYILVSDKAVSGFDIRFPPLKWISEPVKWLSEVLAMAFILVTGTYAVVVLYRQLDPKSPYRIPQRLLPAYFWTLVAAPTLLFALITALLVRAGALSMAHSTTTHLVTQAFGTYAWNLADAVPVLQIPATVHWTQAHQLNGSFGGSLVLAFKLAVILPGIHLLVGYLRTRTSEPTAPSPPNPAD